MSNLDFTDMDVEILYFMFDVPCFFYPNVIFFLLELGLFSHVFRPFGRPLHRSGRPNSGAQETIFKFSFFSCISTKKIWWSIDQWFHNASNYLEMAYNTKMLTEEKNNETKRSKQKKKVSSKVFSFI